LHTVSDAKSSCLKNELYIYLVDVVTPHWESSVGAQEYAEDIGILHNGYKVN
jgi:hypothetical protein